MDELERTQATTPQPAQQQDIQPGRQNQMHPEPITIREGYRGSGKLAGLVALISGGDSGIGRAVAVHFAREGADVAIAYLEEDDDAARTRKLVENEGRQCQIIAADVSREEECIYAVEETIRAFGRLDVLVNNAAQQYPQKDLADLPAEQIERTFRTNIFSYFYLIQAALPYLKSGAAIINTSSITAFRGSADLLDYAASKGAIRSLTYSLADQLADKGIRVNGVAPGPVWTPLIPASFSAEEVAKFGTDTPMKRPAQPSEIAPAYVFLACADAAYINGHFIHINGGDYPT